jgi:hypothetical protein
LKGRADKRLVGILGFLQQVSSGVKRIGSIVDLDARWGRKSKDFPFFGYKVHLACDEKGFVTNLEVLPGEKNEGGRLKEMISGEEGVDGVVADGLYDTASNRRYLRGGLRDIFRLGVRIARLTGSLWRVRG